MRCRKVNMRIKRLVVGVVTFNNHEEELKRFFRTFELSSAKLSPHVEVSLLSIDNGASSWLSKTEKSISLPSRGNLGFAKAVNLLMEYSFINLGADIFITCNPDGFFHVDAISHLLKAALKFPDCLIEAKTFPEEHPKQYEIETQDTLWASGCCLLIPHLIFNKIRGFDEKFFLYMEDVDFSWRARMAGFGIKYCPEALYAHALVGRDEGEVPRRKHLLLSGRYFAWKWGLKKQLKRCDKELLSVYGVASENLQRFSSKSKIKCSRFFRKLLNKYEFFIFSPVRW